MNQSSVVSTMIRSGWELGYIKDGFVNLYKRDRTRNLICPDYFDVTVFPNGRTAEGDYKKYPKGVGAWKQRNSNATICS
jgi:hypothetical protein